MAINVDVQDLHIRLGSVSIVEDLTFSLPAGAFLSVLGPSGSGKTTTLNAIAGFVPVHAGSLRLDGVAMQTVPAHKRGIGIVFQSYALFPHLSVGDNVAYPLKVRGASREECARRVNQALSLVQLPGTENRAITAISGGQRQRVALARALVFEPTLLLLDEPLAALDRNLREAMQLELKRIQRESGVTTIAVTHDQTEALTMSDFVAVMDKGRLCQFGTPEDVYFRPNSRFVADFLGGANIVELSRVGPEEPGLTVIRPEAFGLEAVEGSIGVEGVVRSVAFQGPVSRVVLECKAALSGEVVALLPSLRSVPPDAIGTPLRLHASRAALHRLP